MNMAAQKVNNPVTSPKYLMLAIYTFNPHSLVGYLLYMIAVWFEEEWENIFFHFNIFFAYNQNALLIVGWWSRVQRGHESIYCLLSLFAWIIMLWNIQLHDFTVCKPYFISVIFVSFCFWDTKCSLGCPGTLLHRTGWP